MLEQGLVCAPRSNACVQQSDLHVKFCRLLGAVGYRQVWDWLAEKAW
jgi:hypothetical protein